MNKIGVLGAGAWGTALAMASVRAGRDTLIWALEPEVRDSINTAHENTLYLGGIALDPALKATCDLKDLALCDAVLLVSPAQYMRASTLDLAKYLPKHVPVVICAKGIEISTGKLMSQVIEETMPDQPIAVLSGPTFAAEVANGVPAALTLACVDEDMGNKLTEALGHPMFRPYYSPDIIGSQIGGAIKNVLAIATGIVTGMGMGENTRAAVIARGIAEMMRFGEIYGGDRETLMGLSGLGDLILTCSSTQSRNMSLGKALGEGQTFTEIMAGRNSVAEGAPTVKAVYKIAMDKNIDMPLTKAVYDILEEGKNIKDVVDELLARPFTREDE